MTTNLAPRMLKLAKLMHALADDGFDTELPADFLNQVRHVADDMQQLAVDASPKLERGHMIEVGAPRNGRPGYRWVQGWKIVYPDGRESMPLRLSDARAMLRDKVTT